MNTLLDTINTLGDNVLVSALLLFCVGVIVSRAIVAASRIWKEKLDRLGRK